MDNTPMENLTVQEVFDARTHTHWLPKAVTPEVLREIVRLTLLGPTSANCLPLRIVFLKSKESKEKLKPCLMEGNVKKTLAAPVTAILAFDEKFYEHLPRLFPHTDAKSWFVGKPDHAYETAFRNSSLQIGYFIVAARGLGLDCGPMSGFNEKAVDEAFLAGTSWKSNILCNLGYGDEAHLYPQRSPRFTPEEVYSII